MVPMAVPWPCSDGCMPAHIELSQTRINRLAENGARSGEPGVALGCCGDGSGEIGLLIGRGDGCSWPKAGCAGAGLEADNWNPPDDERFNPPEGDRSNVGRDGEGDNAEDAYDRRSSSMVRMTPHPSCGSPKTRSNWPDSIGISESTFGSSGGAPAMWLALLSAYTAFASI